METNTSENPVIEPKDSATQAEQQPENPVRKELERAKSSGYTEREKAVFNLKKVAEKVRELGEDPSSIVGTPKEEPQEDDRPVTISMLRQMEAERSRKSAEDLADSIADADERELTKLYIRTRIVPSGNPDEDFRFARAMVNSVRNSHIAEEAARGSQRSPASHASSAGMPPKPQEGQFVPTQAEAEMMRGFGITREQVLEARKREEEQTAR